MSYNVDHCEYVGRGRLTLDDNLAKELAVKHIKYLPGCCFLYNFEGGTIETPHWYGEGSGYAYHECLIDILSHTRGKAVLRLIWEGGDSESALVVQEGKVYDGKITISVKKGKRLTP